MSVHCNAGPQGSHGTEVWTMGLHKTTANLGRGPARKLGYPARKRLPAPLQWLRPALAADRTSCFQLSKAPTSPTRCAWPNALTSSFAAAWARLARGEAGGLHRALEIHHALGAGRGGLPN
ncbi:MAG: hypothetical protein WKG07_49485 [Hymenobacter sp.]